MANRVSRAKKRPVESKRYAALKRRLNAYATKYNLKGEKKRAYVWGGIKHIYGSSKKFTRILK